MRRTSSVQISPTSAIRPALAPATRIRARDTAAPTITAHAGLHRDIAPLMVALATAGAGTLHGAV